MGVRKDLEHIVLCGMHPPPGRETQGPRGSGLRDWNKMHPWWLAFTHNFWHPPVTPGVCLMGLVIWETMQTPLGKVMVGISREYIL